jgi:hypothetical protein
MREDMHDMSTMQNKATLAGLQPIGSIGPDKLMRQNIATAGQIDAVCETVVSDDSVWIATPRDDIGDCYDGRPPENETTPMLCAKAAGGFETPVVGLALIGERLGSEICSAQVARLASEYIAAGHIIGGHTGEVHGDPAVDCGCGACDKLQAGLAYIADPAHTPALTETMKKMGVNVDTETLSDIVTRAAELASSGYADGGRRIVDALKKQGGEACAPKLGGDHLEAVVVINRVHGETLDRIALRTVLQEKGLPNVQAFCLDMWAIRDAARNLAPSPDKIEAFVAAMVLHNLAIAAVLCDGSLRVEVR